MMVHCEDAIRLMVVDSGLMDIDGGGIGARLCKWIRAGFACALVFFFPVSSLIDRLAFKPFCLIVDLSMKPPCIGTPICDSTCARQWLIKARVSRA